MDLASVDEVVYAGNLIRVPPFGHKVVHGQTGLTLLGCRMHVMTHGLEKRPPKVPLGLEVLSSYATLATGSCKVTVVVHNTMNDWLKIPKGTPIVRMKSANQIPPVRVEAMAATKPQREKVMNKKARQEALLDKLNLSGLDSWPPDIAAKVCSLLAEYNDIFSLEKHEIGHTKAVKHKNCSQGSGGGPFKELFRRIPPIQVDEVREHLKLKLDAGAICHSNSPWCNAVVLVRKKGRHAPFLYQLSLPKRSHQKGFTSSPSHLRNFGELCGVGLLFDF